MYLLESHRRGDFDRYPQRMFSQRITWDCQRNNKDPLNFCADQIDSITNFVLITNALIKTAVHQTTGFEEVRLYQWIHSSRYIDLVTEFTCCQYENLLTQQKPGSSIIFDKPVDVICYQYSWRNRKFHLELLQKDMNLKVFRLVYVSADSKIYLP